MIRKLTILSVMMVIAIGLAACTAPSPSSGNEEMASEAAPEMEATEAPAEDMEPEMEATDAPAEEPASDEAASEAATYAVDVDASTVNWFGSKPVGGSESGTVAISEGQMNFVGDQLADGSFVIDMTTIETDSQAGGMAEQLVGHLSSDDFFGVETYPTATLVLKSAVPSGEADQYLVTGDLTIKETTKEIEFITNVTVDDNTITANADIIIDRAEFDVQYGSGSFFSDLGDNLISDEIEMSVALVANK